MLGFNICSEAAEVYKRGFNMLGFNICSEAAEVYKRGFNIC
jgi:hypothetical protein